MRGFIALSVFGFGLALAGSAQAQVTLVDPGQAKHQRIPKGVTLAAGSPRAEAPARREAPKLRAGQVLFSVQDADLRREVLPLFEKQAGVEIKWFGEPRQVTLRLVRPVDWEVALDLVAQFTNTHSVRDRGGQVVLKDKWGGTPNEEEAFDDLNGQIDAPKRRSVAASAPKKRKIPVYTKRNIPVVQLGGGTIRMGPQGRAPQPYVSRTPRRAAPPAPRRGAARPWPSF